MSEFKNPAVGAGFESSHIGAKCMGRPCTSLNRERWIISIISSQLWEMFCSICSKQIIASIS